MTDSDQPATKSRQSKWRLVVATLVVLIAVLIGLLPTLVSRSGRIQRILHQQLADRHCDFSMDQIRVGWITPIQLQGIRLQDQDERWKLSVDQIQGNRNLWQLLVSPREVGTLVIDSPNITVQLDQPDQLVAAIDDLIAGDESKSDGTTRDAKIRVVIRNGNVHAYVPQGEQPIHVASDIALDLQWEQTNSHRKLTLAPGRVVEDVNLTPQLCDLGVGYVAPVLADVAWTGGRMSLALDRCVVDWDDASQTDVVGKMSLYSVEAGLKSEISQALANLTSIISKGQLPTHVQLAKNSVIDFEVSNQAVRHKGLEFGLPEVSPELVIRTEGTVTFDKQLDLLATVPLPFHLLGQGKIAQSLGSQSLELPIRGTLDDPKVEIDKPEELVSKLLEPVTSGQIDAADVIDLLQGVQSRIQERRNKQQTAERASLVPRLRRQLRGSDNAEE